MAQDIFAPKSSFNIGYERPVAQPVEDKTGETRAKFEAMQANIQAAQIRAQTQVDRSKLSMANTLLGGIGGFAAGYARGEGRRGEDRARDELFKQFETAEDLRNQNNDIPGALKVEKDAVRKYVSLGYDVDRIKTEYEVIFDRPFEYVGQSRDQQIIAAVENTDEFRMALAAASFKKPNASAEELRSDALMTVQGLAIAQTKLSMVGAGNQLNWESELKGEYNKIVNSFSTGIIADFVNKSKQGEPITLQEISSAMATHDLMRTQLIKPAYVTDEQWGEIKQQLDGQKAFLQTLEKSKNPDELIKNYGSILIQASENEDEAFAVNAALNGEVWAAARGINLPETLNKVAKSPVAQNLFNQKGGILTDLQAVDVTTPVNANTTFTLDTAPEFLQPFLDMSKEKRKAAVDGGVEAINVLKPSDMQNPDSIKQFYNGVMSMTAGMLTEKDFFSSTTLSKIFNNPNLKSSIDMVAAVDREAADEMRIALRSAANLQKTALQANVQSIENSLTGAVWDSQDKTYYITGDAAKIAQGLYKGEMTDKGFKLSPTNFNFPQGYEQAVDIRKSLNIIERSINDLAIDGVEEPTTDLPMPEGITYDLPADVRKDTAFLTEVDKTAKMLGVTSDQLLAIMDFETIGSFSPSEKSGTSTGTGLIQFLESTAGDLGTTTEDLAKMTRAEQMAYVDRYFSRFQGRIKNTGDLYMAVHYPKGVGKNDSFVMYKRGSDEYSANEGLDINNDGTITRGEALQRLRNVTANKFTDVQRIASEAIESATSRPRPQLRPGSMNITQADWWTDEMANTFATRMQAAGLDQTAEDVRYFTSQDEADAAERLGVIKTGDIIVIGTEMVKVD